MDIQLNTTDEYEADRQLTRMGSVINCTVMLHKI